MKHRIEGYQFVSRKTLELGSQGTMWFSPDQRPDIRYEGEISFERKSFELAFARLTPSRPSIGAYQYIDPDVDAFMERRWPFCLVLRGTVELPEDDLPNQLRRLLLAFPRKVVWEPPAGELRWALPDDQRSTQLGYRRQFFHQQPFDIAGNRWPSPEASFVPTELGDAIGPGVVSLPDLNPFADINEMVWSPILPFPRRTTVEEDKVQIDQELAELRLYYNSYEEFFHAERLLAAGEVQCAVWFAASAVDATVRHYLKAWGVPEPQKHLPFEEKVETILASARKPSFRALVPTGSQALGDLYRCRNSMHEGDCFYPGADGTRIEVTSARQVRPWLEVVDNFIGWIDSLV
jgi:hypothetical protein